MDCPAALQSRSLPSSSRSSLPSAAVATATATTARRSDIFSCNFPASGSSAREGIRKPGGELSGVSCGHQKTTGRAPCDAQPGYERDRESLRVSGRFQPTTLKQPQRPQHESQNAAEAIRIDLGDGRRTGVGHGGNRQRLRDAV